MNRVYDPNTSPNGGWTVRVKRHGIKNVGAVYKKSFTSFPARFLAILVDYHLGVGLNEVQVIGKGKDSIYTAELYWSWKGKGHFLGQWAGRELADKARAKLQWQW